MVEGIDIGDHIVLRNMTREDIPLGMRLKSLAGWNQLEADWEMFLDAGGNNFVASLNDNNVGTVVSIPYSDHFTWIGMVLVDPVARRKGIGTALLKKSIECSLVKGPVRLDATANGYELYKAIGFVREYELVRMTRKPGHEYDKCGSSCQPVQTNDLPAILAYDAPVFGADRNDILISLYNRNPEYATCINDNDSLTAYCMGRSGSRYEMIGPVVAEDFEQAKHLLLDFLQKCSGRDLVIDAFSDKPDWIIFLESIGFIKQRSFIRMCLGELRHKGITSKQFAIAGPEIG